MTAARHPLADGSRGRHTRRGSGVRRPPPAPAKSAPAPAACPVVRSSAPGARAGSGSARPPPAPAAAG
ncbi:hypothetical protein G6F32_017302 [Rhizopus arrhizus]|nr:hypothetical protein G6F32_017302 [Rhizopus arrhizus]